MDLKEFGREIKRLRCEKGMSLEKLAEKSGYSKITIFNVENGYKVPRQATAEDIVHALGKKLVINWEIV